MAAQNRIGLHHQLAIYRGPRLIQGKVSGQEAETDGFGFLRKERCGRQSFPIQRTENTTQE